MSIIVNISLFAILLLKVENSLQNATSITSLPSINVNNETLTTISSPTDIDLLENISENRNNDNFTESTEKSISISIMNIMGNPEATTIKEDQRENIQTTTKVSLHDKYSNTTNADDKPDSCSESEKFIQQPVKTSYSHLKKCCPLSEGFPNISKPFDCINIDQEFKMDILNVTIYENCILATDSKEELEIKIGNPCNRSYVASEFEGDRFYIIQNGSLLLMDINGNETFTIKNDYCIDSDNEKNLYAIVCVDILRSQLAKGQTIIFTIFMLISLPCLILVSFFHFSIKKLRTIHGLSLGCMCCSLAIGFFLHSIAEFVEGSRMKLGYAVQYFMLAYFSWLLALCLNTVITGWYFLPRYVRFSATIRYFLFISYSVGTFLISFFVVLITQSKGLSGMPSYFYQAWTEESSQRYFIPPVTSILVVCDFLLVLTYVAFRKLEKISNRQIEMNRNKIYLDTTTVNYQILDQELYRETKKDAKSITYLVVIITTTWIMEIITFYSPAYSDSLAFLEIINGLQGFFILMIFIIIRNRRQIIVRWWHDRGSHDIRSAEQKAFNTKDRM